jgi:hypothetical protein
MTILKLAFDLYAGANRAYSAKDVEVRLPVQVANPRVITSELRKQGKIAFDHQHGGERFYKLVPGATPPIDGRAFNCVQKASGKRLLRSRAARARLAKRVRKA